MKSILKFLILLSSSTTIAACGGGGGSNSTADGSSATGIEPTRAISTLSATERRSICIQGILRPQQLMSKEDYCRSLAVTFGAFSTFIADFVNTVTEENVVSPSTSEDLVAQCQQSAALCEQHTLDPEKAVDNGHCDLLPDGCSATVGELEKCYEQQSQQYAEIAPLLQCNLLSDEANLIQSQGAQSDPESCTRLEKKCPRIFDADVAEF